MAKNRMNQGGPTRNPKDEPTRERVRARTHSRAQAQSKPEGDDERRNRAGITAHRSRTGSKSNAS